MNYEEYLEKRNQIEEENAVPVGILLNEREERLDKILERLREEAENCLEGDRIYKMPVLRYGEIQNTSLYRFSKLLPKGSDLHVHAQVLLPAHKLIGFVASRPELVVDPLECKIRNRAEPDLPERCLPLQEAFDKGVLDRTDMEKKWSLLGVRHDEDVWKYFEKLLTLFKAIEYEEETLYQYYITAFDDYLKNNIFHIEIHALLSDRFERAKALAETIKQAYLDVKRRRPELQVSLICAGLKYNGIDRSTPKKYLDNALKLRECVQDDSDPAHPCPFVIGFDLVNEEDRSITLKELAPMLLECREKHPDFQLYIHGGESLDAKSSNLIDAYLLDAVRVGHGMNLYRFPSLMQKYLEREICLESCIVSNQSLRYVKDLRLHPCYTYLKMGLPVALCSDDPVCQEKEQLTDDFFAAILCWKLGLSEIKQLCVNSILYSGLNGNQKSELMRNWRQAWDEFVLSAVEQF